MEDGRPREKRFGEKGVVPVVVQAEVAGSVQVVKVASLRQLSCAEWI
jgi:hypothetical protein